VSRVHTRSPSTVLSAHLNELVVNTAESVVGSGTYGVVFDAKAECRPGGDPTQELLNAAAKSRLVRKHKKRIEDENMADTSEFAIQSVLTENQSSYESGILKLICPDGVMMKCDAILSSIIPKLQRCDADNPLLHDFMLNFLQSMCRALTTLKQHEYIHGDPKPENIGMRFKENGDIFFVLFDLGSAKKYDRISEKSLTHGTPGFMSPEVICGELPKNDKNKLDIYSIGRVLFLMLIPGAKILQGLATVKEVSDAHDAAKRNPPIDHKARMYRIFNAQTISQKLLLMTEAMCETLAENRLSLEELCRITQHLECEILPYPSVEGYAALFEWYRTLIEPAVEQSYPSNVTFNSGDAGFFSSPSAPAAEAVVLSPFPPIIAGQ